MWYIVYANVAHDVPLPGGGVESRRAGQMISVGTTLGEGIPGPLLGAVPYETRPDLDANVWDEAQRMLVPRPPAPPARVLSKRRFMGRIPVDHFVALNALRLDPATPIALKAVLETARELRDMVSEVNLDDPGTQQFVPVATDALIGVGQVAAADRAAYIAAWLADPE